MTATMDESFKQAFVCTSTRKLVQVHNRILFTFLKSFNKEFVKFIRKG